MVHDYYRCIGSIKILLQVVYVIVYLSDQPCVELTTVDTVVAAIAVHPFLQFLVQLLSLLSSLKLDLVPRVGDAVSVHL